MVCHLTSLVHLNPQSEDLKVVSKWSFERRHFCQKGVRLAFLIQFHLEVEPYMNCKGPFLADKNRHLIPPNIVESKEITTKLLSSVN